ncbi:SatD family protein [Bordetella genomosp. 1]|uniref:SatD family (SatD) n=1 Tax=Bordetella genomosp. 1 TaxID=1395607 RepID=A0ABX4F424_9BORD|nr:SatD family protein [Bordetella genomosp. 1]OZI68412.1 hypothetical protein CAL27_02815 [Bordetella genomosp. 1]
MNHYSHAVVMGDLVSSEGTGSVPRLHRAFNAAIDAANRTHGASLPSPLTITLGDEFQGVSRSLSEGLEIVRSLRTQLLADAVDCRFVLGVVRLDVPVNPDRAWNMMGPGFAASRERLGDKRDRNAYRFVLPGQPVIETLMEAVGAALTDIEADWTDRQKEVVLASQHERGTDVAERLAISPPTYYKIRRAGRFDLYAREWQALMSSAQALDTAYGLA